jgi:hypothetical protein
MAAECEAVSSRVGVQPLAKFPACLRTACNPNVAKFLLLPTAVVPMQGHHAVVPMQDC